MQICHPLKKTARQVGQVGSLDQVGRLEMRHPWNA
jgi:hypothetical protein